jgi:uncharacterized membrane protein YhfC
MKTKRTFPFIALGSVAIIITLTWVLYPDTVPAFMNVVLMLVIPLAIGALIFNRTKADWSIFGIGALTFVASQVLHIPFNSYILDPLITSLGLKMAPNTFSLLLIGVFYGLSAGIFEELSRYFVYKKYLSEKRSWGSGIMFGAGHGGIEAILLGVIVLFTFLQMFALKGASSSVLSESIPVEQMDLVAFQIDQFWASPWWMHLLGVLERVFAITMHVFMALLVQRAVIRKQLRWLWAAVLFHTLIDMTAVYGISSFGVIVTESALLTLAAIAILMIFKFGRESLAVLPEIYDIPVPVVLKTINKLDSVTDIESKMEESKYD